MSETINTLNLLEVQVRVSEADEQIIRADERAKVIEEIRSKCSKEYQAWSDDTVCKIWLSDLEQICSTKQ